MVVVQEILIELFKGARKALISCIMTAERCYRKESFMNLMMLFGIFSLSVMSDHVLRSHYFIVACFLNSNRDDEDEEIKNNVKITYGGCPEQGLESTGQSL